MTKKDYEEFDYLIGMDSANIRNMTRIAGGDPEQKIFKMLCFGEDGRLQEARDVADPWYTGNFDVTYEDVCRGCEGFLAYLEAEDAIPRRH